MSTPNAPIAAARRRRNAGVGRSRPRCSPPGRWPPGAGRRTPARRPAGQRRRHPRRPRPPPPPVLGLARLGRAVRRRPRRLGGRTRADGERRAGDAGRARLRGLAGRRADREPAGLVRAGGRGTVRERRPDDPRQGPVADRDAAARGQRPGCPGQRPAPAPGHAQPGTVCPALAIIPPQIVLISATGQELIPRLPVSGCGLIQSQVLAALAALPWQPGLRPADRGKIPGASAPDGALGQVRAEPLRRQRRGPAVGTAAGRRSFGGGREPSVPWRSWRLRRLSSTGAGRLPPGTPSITRRCGATSARRTSRSRRRPRSRRRSSRRRPGSGGSARPSTAAPRLTTSSRGPG